MARRRIDLSRDYVEQQLGPRSTIHWLTTAPAGAVRRAVAYVRLSVATEANTMNLDGQIEACLALATANGVVLVAIIVEHGESAFGGKAARPGYAELCRLVGEQHLDVVAFQQERLTREPIELETLKVLAHRAGVRIITGNGITEPGDPSSAMLSGIIGHIAKMDSAVKSNRSKAKHAELARRGLPATRGGARPFAFADDRITLVEGEAAALRRVVDALLDGATLHGLVATLNREGITTTTGKAFTLTTLRQVLRARRYRRWADSEHGTREHKRRDLDGKRETVGEYEAAWPYVIEGARFDLVQSLLDDTSRRTNQRQRKYLLSGGLLRCGKCGAKLISRPQSGRPTYRCAKDHGGCGGLTVTALPVEACVEQLVLDKLGEGSQPQRARYSVGADADKLAKTRLDLERATRMAVDGDLDPAEYRVHKARLLDQISELEAAINRSQAPSWVTAPGAIVAEWDAMTDEAKRAVIADVIEHAVVEPRERAGCRFDPTRVVPVWTALFD